MTIDEILNDIGDFILEDDDIAPAKQAIREAIERAIPAKVEPSDFSVSMDYANGRNEGIDEYYTNLLREIGLDEPNPKVQSKEDQP